MKRVILSKSAAAVQYLDSATNEWTAIAEGKTGALRIVGGGGDIAPLHGNNLSVNVTNYKDGTAYKSTTTLTPNGVGVYTIIIVEKGKKFNERNKYSFDKYYATAPTAAGLVTDFMEMIAGTKTTDLSGTIQIGDLAGRIKVSKASTSATAITIEGINKGEDFAVLFADNLSSIKEGIITNATPVIADAKWVANLMSIGAADKGYNYTYEEALYELYPNYKENPLAGAISEDKGFDVVNIRFAEPRATRTRDENVNQMIHVIFPRTGVSASASVEALITALDKIDKSAPVSGGS